MHSQEIGQLLEALAKAQSVMQGAIEDSKNPFFKSNYADLTSVWEACRDPLTKNGLSVIQTVQVLNGANCLVTMLGHTSGQWIKSVLPIKAAREDIQSLGSAITYSRRYSLAALVGVCPADDDGEAAMNRNQRAKTNDEVPVTMGFSVPDDVDKALLEEFINESSTISKQSRNYIIASANKHPDKFLEAFKKWELKENKKIA